LNVHWPLAHLAAGTQPSAARQVSGVRLRQGMKFFLYFLEFKFSKKEKEIPFHKKLIFIQKTISAFSNLKKFLKELDFFAFFRIQFLIFYNYSFSTKTKNPPKNQKKINNNFLKFKIKKT
jgi:hypothetical protein